MNAPWMITFQPVLIALLGLLVMVIMYGPFIYWYRFSKLGKERHKKAKEAQEEYNRQHPGEDGSVLGAILLLAAFVGAIVLLVKLVKWAWYF